MTRKMMLTTTAATLIALPGLLAADSPQASTDTSTEVGSENTAGYETNSPEASSFAEMDPVTIGMDQELFDALLASPGTNILTDEGEVVGVVENVMINGVGNPELVINLTNQSEIPAEVLVVTIQPGNVMTRDGLLFVDTSVDELQLLARNNAGRDSRDRVQITLF